MGRRLLRVTGLLLLAVLLAEGLVRLVEPRLPPPLVWPNASTQRLATDMDALSEAGVRGGLVLAGTSQTNTDLLPEVFEDELASVDHAANVGLAAATTRVNQRWLLRQVQPRLQPSKVIWGVTSLDFNAHRKPDTFALYLSSRAARPGLAGSLDRKLSRASALVRHRSLLADPVAFVMEVRDGVASPDTTPLNERAKHRAPDRIDKAPSEVRRLRTTVLHDYAIGDAEVRAFRTTLERLQEDGVEVVVVLLPVPPQFIAAHPDGRADFDAYRTTARATARASGVAVIDRSEAFEEPAFRDYTHLLLEPALQLSRDISRELQRRGW